MDSTSIEKIEEPKKKISVQIVRKNGKTYFKFKVDSSIEKMYSEQAKETRDSKNWAGLTFYLLPNLISSQTYKNKLQLYRLFDDFGAPIYSNGNLNIAWLRTVGGKGEVVIENELSFAELSQLTKNALSFIKEYFDDYYRGFTIKGSVSVEL